MNKKPLILLVFFLTIGLLGAISVRTAPAGTVLENDFELQVVRAYFDDPAMINEVAQWNEPWEVDLEAGYLVVDVTPIEYQRLLDLGFRVEVDLALTEEINRPRVPLPGQVDGIPGYPCYRTVEETFASAADMAANYPTLATWTDIGDSWDKVTPGGPAGYDLQVLRLTNQAIPGPKPVLYLFGAIHSREYVTAETATRFAEYLLANYGSDADVTWLLDYHQLDLALQVNPDGRKKAESGLSWRKNTNNSDGCLTSYGVDLNRNFEFYWNSGGSSGDACNETYRGSSAASEPETQTLQDYAYTIFPDQRADPITATAPITSTGIFLDIHAYGEDIRWPWGFTSTPPPNGDGITTLARKLGYYSGYDPLQSTYATSGTTKDFMYGEFGVPGYTIELGTSFFQSCSYFESNVWPDMLPLLMQAAKSTRFSYIIPAGPDSVNLILSQGAVVAGEPVELSAIVDDTRYNNSQGTEPSQNVIAAELYVDVPEWLTGATPIPMSAVDGSFNETVEDVVVTLDTSGYSSGRHTLFMRGQDAAGNWGAFSAVYLEVIDPGAAPIIEGTVTDSESGAPLSAVVEAGIFQTTTDPVTGFYQLQVISGTHDISAVAANHAIQTVTVQVEDYQTLQQDFSLLPVCSAFADDVEMGANGWQGIQPWAITDEAAHSPIHSWTDSPGGDYENNWDRWLRSPVIDMTGYDHATLSFWQICDTQVAADYCIVEVSPDGGTSWTEVARFDGPASAWEQVTLDVPTLSNEANARIRLVMHTDGAVTADGWHIDDVRLMGSGPNCDLVQPPTAGFIASADHVGVGDVIQFTNTSTGDNLTFEWDFDDGSPISVEENPSHAFQVAGTYMVSLTASNAAGSDSYSLQIQVDAEPTAGFTASTDHAGVGEVIQFTNSSTGDNLTFEWDFDDGSPISSEENPSHAFQAAGTYTVSLTASNAAGSDSYSLQIQVDAEPTAGFTASTDHAGVGEVIQFTNSSTGDNLTFEWDFDDGSPISNEENPSHAFQAAGTYTVSLTASNAAGSDSYSLQIQVDAQPTAGFTASTDRAGIGDVIQLTNSSTGDNLTFEWDFGDGSPVSSEENPSHVFLAPGTYTVTLTASNAAGSDSFSLQIRVDALLYLPAIING